MSIYIMIPVSFEDPLEFVCLVLENPFPPSYRRTVFFISRVFCFTYTYVINILPLIRTLKLKCLTILSSLFPDISFA